MIGVLLSIGTSQVLLVVRRFTYRDCRDVADSGVRKGPGVVFTDLFVVCWSLVERVVCSARSWTINWSLERMRKSGVGKRGLRLKYNKLSYMGRTTGYLYLIGVSHKVAAYDE